MSNKMLERDYRINGVNTKKAHELGLVQAEWYQTSLPRAQLKQFMQRSDQPAIRDTFIWLGLLLFLGYMIIVAWGTWWVVPLMIIYGGLYCISDSRWHETGHGTAFKTPWMNEVIYQIASFMMLRSPTPWKWSHARHHSDTYVVGRDPEIAPRPAKAKRIILGLLNLHGGPYLLKVTFLHLLGKLTDDEKEYIPVTEHRKTFWESRIHVTIMGLVILACILSQSILPAILVGLPSFYGFYILILLNISQHIGLYENVLDHRLNARTYLTNRIFRFLYWNMNYHIEHHMFPMVPYHALPRLHEAVKHDYPPPCPSLWSAFRESLFAIWKQRDDPDFVIVRDLPPTANPYKYR
jgi:fatty acid desaturase